MRAANEPLQQDSLIIKQMMGPYQCYAKYLKPSDVFSPFLILFHLVKVIIKLSAGVLSEMCPPGLTSVRSKRTR